MGKEIGLNPFMSAVMWEVQTMRSHVGQAKVALRSRSEILSECGWKCPRSCFPSPGIKHPHFVIFTFQGLCSEDSGQKHPAVVGTVTCAGVKLICSPLGWLAVLLWAVPLFPVFNTSHWPETLQNICWVVLSNLACFLWSLWKILFPNTTSSTLKPVTDWPVDCCKCAHFLSVPELLPSIKASLPQPETFKNTGWSV